MKKSLIAASASAVVLAAMPIVGTFAATSNSFTDTLTVTLQNGCTLENSTATAGTYTTNDRSFEAAIAAGTVGYLNADETGAAITNPTEGTITVQCNTSDSTKTYTVAVDVTDFTDSATPTAHTFTGGTATSGDASKWAIKSNASGTTASNPFANYAAATDTTFLTATANNSVTFNPSYQVYIAPGQVPGTYVASAKYTVTIPSGS